MNSARRSLNFRTRLLDLLAVIALVLVAAVLSVFLQFNFLTTTLLFFGLPSAYLIWRKPSNFKKAAVAGALLGLVWGFSFDYLAEFNYAWGWSTNTTLAFPIEFFGVVSLDIMLWYFLWIFLIVTFYEYFAEYDFSKRIAPRAGWSALFGGIVAIMVVSISKSPSNNPP